jgi:hypothetical protein
MAEEQLTPEEIKKLIAERAHSMYLACYKRYQWEPRARELLALSL